jgi:CBS domain-containing protein
MIDVPVSSAMVERDPIIPPTATTQEAAEQLRDPETPALFVEAEDELVGVVTEADIVATIAEGGENPPVEAYMSTPVQTVNPTQPIGFAADKMRDSGVSVLAVVDGGYVGYVTVGKLAPYLPRHRLEVTWDGDPVRLSDS